MNGWVAFVCRNPGEDTLYEVSSELNATTLQALHGEAIMDFFPRYGVTVRQYMELFPGCVSPMDELHPSWDGGFSFLGLPLDEDGLQRLADLLGKLVIAFSMRKGDAKPTFLRKADPTSLVRIPA